MNQAKQWNEDGRFQAPMIVHGDGHIFIGDLVEVIDQQYGKSTIKVKAFKTKVYHHDLYYCHNPCNGYSKYFMHVRTHPRVILLINCAHSYYISLSHYYRRALEIY